MGVLSHFEVDLTLPEGASVSDPEICRPMLAKKKQFVQQCLDDGKPLHALLVALRNPPYDCPEDEIKTETTQLVMRLLVQVPVPAPDALPAEVDVDSCDILMRYFLAKFCKIQEIGFFSVISTQNIKVFVQNLANEVTTEDERYLFGLAWRTIK